MSDREYVQRLEERVQDLEGRVVFKDSDFETPDGFDSAYSYAARRLYHLMRNGQVEPAKRMVEWAILSFQEERPSLDDFWQDVPSIASPAMARLAQLFEDQGKRPTIRALLEIPELMLQVWIRECSQTGPEVLEESAAVRDEDSPWVKMLGEERAKSQCSS